MSLEPRLTLSEWKKLSESSKESPAASASPGTSAMGSDASEPEVGFYQGPPSGPGLLDTIMENKSLIMVGAGALALGYLLFRGSPPGVAVPALPSPTTPKV